ncbi:uncharacterized protein LOC121377006 [Gigantopelta aegis]|uniref:uncharacterized protein LOC121377006 n=1 Tax=Gigantopelta aegis TaxID=1735272 RepID=UPI001B88DA0B|nr:uncharacterized protein LOC121377006 [Gigantopelta aegis]
MSDCDHSTTMKNHNFQKPSCCFRTAAMVLFILSSTVADLADSTVENRQLSQNEILRQYPQTIKQTSPINSLKSELKSNSVNRINLLNVHQADKSGGFKRIPSAESKIVHKDGTSVHSAEFSDVSMKELIMNVSSSDLESDSNNQKRMLPENGNALKSRKERSLHNAGKLPDNNHTTPKPLPASPASAKIGVISPTPVLPSATSESLPPGEEYESPQEIQDDKNEDMLNLLNARGFSYTALPEDMMSKYPDIVQQVEADEMDGPEGQGDGGQGQEGQGEVTESPDNEGNENEGKENDGKDTEGPEEEEGNEAGDSDQGENEQSESPESARNQTESETGSRRSGHDEHSENQLQSSMTELQSGGSTDRPYNRHNYEDFSYDPYYDNAPGHTALAGGQQSAIVTHQIHRLPNMADVNSRQNRSGGFGGVRNSHSQQNRPVGFLPIFQHENTSNRNPGHNRPNSGAQPPPGFLPMHQLHTIGSASTGQTHPRLGSQSNLVAGSATQTKIVNTGMAASTIFGIVAGCVIGSWMILGPMICLLCKYRDSRSEKRKRFSPRMYRGDSNNGITEAMIMSELGKDPIKLHHTKFKQRESTYSEKSDTFHDAYETPSLLL